MHRPPVYFFLYLAIAIALHFVLPIAKIISYPYNLVGFLLIAFGLVINIKASMLFFERKTSIIPFEKSSALITDWPFSLTRNPIYLGGFLMWLGIAFLLGSIAAFFAPIASIITIDMLFVRKEEKMLEETFGKKYLDYKTRVRRWV